MEIRIFCHGEVAGVLDYVGGFRKLPLPKPERAEQLELRFSVPFLDIQGYWIPKLRAPSMKTHWTIESVSAGQRDFPFMAFLNTSQRNRFSFGLTDLIDDAGIIARMNQEKCTYDIAVTVAVREETKAFSLVLDDRDVVWTEALADWRNSLELPKPEFPDGAWQPVFCTWYAVHAAVTQDWVEKNAEIAAALGFGTLIIDDGWCFDVMKRVSPQTITSWYEWIGDWELSKKKFPDYENHRRRIRELGLNYLLWVAPFLIGEKSGFRKLFPDGYAPGAHEGCFALDSRKRDAVSAMLDKMKSLIGKYDLDGLKIDFLDHFAVDVDKPAGRDTIGFVAELSAAIREAKPDALIEFRQQYCTPLMMGYATQFRAGDVPFEFLDNFNRIIQIRISMGDGVPVHADPVYWHPQESKVNIARHMISALAGVPMLSMDLLSIGDVEKKIIAFWLGFYREHLDALRHGRWQAVFHMGSAVYAAADTPSERLVFLTDPARLAEAVRGGEGKTVVLLNLTLEELPLAGAQTYAPDGEAGTAGIVPPGGCGIVAKR